MARKSKAFGELLNEHQLEKSQEKALKKFQKQLKRGNEEAIEIVSNPAGQEKMSAVLEAFVEPYLPETRTYEEQHMLFSMAVVAWNLALFPEANRQAELEKFLQLLSKPNDSSVRQEMKELLEEMVERKQLFFADNKRHIVSFELERAGKTNHLSVASTPAP